MDGAQVLRSYRSAFTLPEYLPYMPDSFATVADPKLREFRADDDFLQGLLDYPPLLHGYGTPWDPELGPSFGIEPGEFSHGVQYTLTCREELPSFDRAAADRLAAGETAFVRAYIDSIWTEICAIWNVAPGAADTNAPVSSDIPTLFLVGRFDAASPLQAVTELATGFSRGHLVEVPPLAHYTLNGDLGVCPREIRNAWVQSPENPPVTSCLAGMPRISFEVP
jgi:pimeloyl-ACP methyl ester carboxylesterase